MIIKVDKKNQLIQAVILLVIWQVNDNKILIKK
jgi:hypothetical protein